MTNALTIQAKGAIATHGAVEVARAIPEIKKAIAEMEKQIKAHVTEHGPLRDNGEIYAPVEVYTERIIDQAAAVETLIDAGAPLDMLKTTQTALTTFLRSDEVDKLRDAGVLEKSTRKRFAWKLDPDAAPEK